jgi:sn-glycerol 3-phosphate transport system ATP-binding protein
MTMADQVLLMRQGRIEQDGSPAELYERPATRFAARFIGTPPMNIVPATALGSLWPRLECAAPGRRQNALSIGVRAEAARLSSSGMEAQVMAVEYLGADSLIDTRIGDAPFVLRVSGRSPLAAGERVAIEWDASATHLFDATTGSRIS